MTYPDFFDEWNNPKDFITVKTSGSTGEPKIIQLSKKFVEESALRTNKFFGITSLSHLHSCISPDFIGGKMMAVRAMVSGAHLTWEIPSNQALKDRTLDEKIDLVAVVPSQMLHIVENIEKIPQVINFLIGGAPVNNTLAKRIFEKGIRAYESYGMTETASHIALRKIGKELTPFQTLPGISIECNDSGCLIINYKDGRTISTNDLARIITPDQFYITGRADNIINTGGKKISADILEAKLSQIINAPYCISSLPDDKWGEKIILLIEKHEDDIDKDILNKKMRQLLEDWQLPKEIYLIDKIPLTENGKIKRSQLYKKLGKIKDV